jgi:uncharacterized membrane protein
MQRINFSLPWPLSANETREILSFAFQVALVTYLGFYLMESLKPGFVTFFYNLDTFLWIAIITGLLSSIWPAIVKDAKKEQSKPTWKDFVWMGLLAIGTVAVVWYKTSSVGWLVKVIAPLSGLIVLGLSLLVYYDRDDEPESND